MAHNIKSPGVSVQVKDQSSFVATAGGTISATAGFASKGPIGEPVFIVSKEAYFDAFGEPISDNYYMGMFADKFLNHSIGWFTRVAKEKDFERLVGAAPASLDYTSVASPEFWIVLADFPAPNNGIFKISFTGGGALADIDALVDAVQDGVDSITLPDGVTPLSNYITVMEEDGHLVLRSDNYMNVKISVKESDDAANNVVGTGLGKIGIQDGATSTDVGSYSHAFARVPVGASPATNASITSSSEVTQNQLNRVSAFNFINLKIDGDTATPLKVYEDVNITPTMGTAATFPALAASNAPVLSSDLSTSTFDIILSGFYDLMAGDSDGDVNNTFTITTAVDGSETQFTVSELVTNLNAQLLAATINANNLRNYVQFEVFETDKIRLVNGDGSRRNFGSQVSVTISDNTGDISNLGYISPTSTITGSDATWTLENVAQRINSAVAEATITASSGRLTIQSDIDGLTSFVEINEATTSERSGVTNLNFVNDQSSTGTAETNNGVINFVAKDAGTFGNQIKTRTFTTTNPVTGNTIYNLEVSVGEEVVEIYNNVNWIDESSSNFVGSLIEASQHVAIDFGETVQYPATDLQSAPEYPAPNNGEDGRPDFWTLSGGNDGVPTEDNEIDALIVNALDEYLNKEQYQIDLILAPGFVGTPVVSKLVSIGEARRDLLALVDPPPFLDWKEIIKWHNGEYAMGAETSVSLASQYTVAVWGWQRDFDPYNNQFIDLPPSIYEAIAMATTESNYEVWEAPAGERRGVVNSISSYTKPTQAQREYLYNDVDPACINPIVQMPGKGTLIYGQKTCLRQNKAMNRINVVRLVNRATRNIESMMSRYIFETSTPATWANVARDINSYLGNIQQRGGLTTFSVIFDGTTNTPEKIDQGIMYGKIFIQPTRVAERIFIDLTIQNTGATATA